MTNCRICGTTNFEEIILEGFTIQKCKNCGLGLLKNYPTAEEVKQIYNPGYFNSKTLEDHKNDSKKKYNFMKNYLSIGSKILDYGCGTGNFIKAAKEGGMDVCGFDVSAFASETVSRELGVLVKSGEPSPELYPKEAFDAIVAFDVIEHLTDFDIILDYYYLWLKPGGYLFFTTPNLESWDSKILGKSWYGYKKYPEHINYFTPKSIKLALEKFHYNVVEIKTWGFIRSLNYIVSNLVKNPILKNYLSKCLTKTHLENLEVYLPMVDMVVVAHK